MSYFSLSVQLLIIVKNLGFVLEHKLVKKAAFSLHSRTTTWLKRTSLMLHLRKTEQLRTRNARFQRLVVFNRIPLKENTTGYGDETSKALLCAKPFKIVCISMCTQNCAKSPYIIRVEELNLRTEKICPSWLIFDCGYLRS